MKQDQVYPKIARGTFHEQFKWSLWFFGFLTAAHIIGLIIVNITDEQLLGFFVFSTHSVSIFLLVCGIISVYVFMGLFVQQGVTRKDSYLGIAIAALALTFAVTLISLVLNAIEQLIAGSMSLPLETDVTNMFEPAAGWFAAACYYYLNMLTYYLVGWFIGVGYYRYGWLIGFVFVALAILAISINGYFWGDADLSSIIPLIPHSPADASPVIAVIGSLILNTALLISIRLLTKRMAIKL
ncbi:hypothetical protein [Planococcus sp. CAU13]|uniref:hypothetical protein n=1 Tax=Planococcus sp. CAU13 TaxID=1541197 RepID=UPI0005300864|nr:hypothetical protein [Planococcus sp. CAU13]